jgi:hypothetical protein
MSLDYRLMLLSHQLFRETVPLNNLQYFKMERKNIFNSEFGVHWQSSTRAKGFIHRYFISRSRKVDCATIIDHVLAVLLRGIQLTYVQRF